jgi:hypothetical protein
MLLTYPYYTTNKVIIQLFKGTKFTPLSPD